MESKHRNIIAVELRGFEVDEHVAAELAESVRRTIAEGLLRRPVWFLQHRDRQS